MIDADLYTLLAAIGTTSPGTVPDDTDPPYIVYSRVNTSPGNLLDGAPKDEHISFAIDVHATSALAARTLADQIKTALQAASFGGYVLGDRDMYEPEVKLYRVIIDFDVIV